MPKPEILGLRSEVGHLSVIKSRMVIYPHWSSVKPKNLNELSADSGSLRETVKNLYDKPILLQV